MKRKIISPDDLQKIVKDYLDGWSMCDLAKEYKFSYDTIRYAIKSAIDSDTPSAYRKEYWKRNNFIPVKVRNEGSDLSSDKINSMLQNKCIPIVVSLIKNREMSHSEIGRSRCCSREYVGKVAEACASYGLDVSRLGKSADNCNRGKIS